MRSRESICLVHSEFGTIRWRHVPINRITGQGNLSITTRDLATIGELMLNDGVAQTRIKRSFVTRRSKLGPLGFGSWAMGGGKYPNPPARLLAGANCAIGYCTNARSIAQGVYARLQLGVDPTGSRPLK